MTFSQMHQWLLVDTAAVENKKRISSCPECRSDYLSLKLSFLTGRTSWQGNIFWHKSGSLNLEPTIRSFDCYMIFLLFFFFYHENAIEWLWVMRHYSNEIPETIWFDRKWLLWNPNRKRQLLFAFWATSVNTKDIKGTRCRSISCTYLLKQGSKD